MQKVETLFSQALYEKSLSTINGIHFTKREIDVMACLLSGRRTSKTAQFLSINPRTVETHIRNIMYKLECNTRESIIDFIEAADKVHYLRKCYSLLQLEAIFKKSLIDISKLNREKKPRCSLKFAEDNEPLGFHLKSHLTLVGITVLSSAKKKDGDYVIIIGPKTMTEEETFPLPLGVNENPSKVVFLLQNRKNYKELPKWLANVDVVDCEKHENYYFSFFILLQKLLPNVKLDEIISRFEDKYKKIPSELASPPTPSNKVNNKSLFTPLLSLSRPFYFMVLTIGLILSGGFLTLQWCQKNKEHDTLRSDLAIPKESAFLNRPELISQIHDKFRGQSGIQTVALVGAGGAGKTTLARQYAHSQNQLIVWEINAETRENLRSSFESLAQALAKTEVDQKILKGIQRINESPEKEDQIILFVKERLKSKSGWFLIFDNVNKFTDIQKHFPPDSDTWGQGKIILTTRDTNIGNNEHVNYTIFISELNPHQKFSLFTKIMRSEDQGCFTKAQAKELELFLEKLPPFPLDITIAAHYLKTTEVPYDRYLKYLEESSDEFEKVNENILQDTGDYKKTRYNIIATSVKKVIENHKDFSDLLLFISLLDSQNIPRDLLNGFKSEVIVDNFIFNLKKYSLITSESLIPAVGSVFSIHRSMKIIQLDYLIKKINIGHISSSIHSINLNFEKNLEKIIDDENLLKMNLLLIHCESFLKNNELLNFTNFNGAIHSKLGCMYYYLGQHVKAKQFLEKSLKELSINKNENQIRIAWVLAFLGDIYRFNGEYVKAKSFLNHSLAKYKNHDSENHDKIAWVLTIIAKIYWDLGDYEKSKELLEKSLNIYKMHPPKNKEAQAWNLGCLGNTHRDLGNYEKAEEYLKESINIYKNFFSADNASFVWALVNLAEIQRRLGNYESARILCEQGLNIYKKNLSKDNIRIAWVSTHLGSIYVALGNHKKAQVLLEYSLIIYKNNFLENNTWIAWNLAQLGIAYEALGQYDKAKNSLEQSLVIYNEHYGPHHLETARVLRSLGRAYLLEDKKDKAESLYLRSLQIFQDKNHPDIYMIFEELSDLHKIKSDNAMKDGNVKQSHVLHKQSCDDLKQALEIVKTHFSKNSPHIIRIQAKLKALQ